MSLFRNTSAQIVTFFCLQLHILLFLLINISQFPTACHGCQEQERRALLDFKLSLEDPANRLSSWLEGNNYRNCCNWQGIGCSRDSSPRVISINLRNTALETYNNEYVKEGFNTEVPTPPNTALHGKFSSSFVNITHLEYLDLAFNNFHESPIPFQFSKLTKLVHLDLSHLNFSVSVSTPFTNLSSLEYLDLSCGISDYSFRTASCLESSSLKWLRRLANLKTLRLSGIDLHEAASSENNFAESVSYLSNLRDLDLSSCHIPITFFSTHKFHNLSRLSYLKLSTNFEINFIPLQLVNFTSLSTLDLSGCGLEGSAVPYLPQLTELDVSYNYDFHPDLTRMFQHQWPKLQRLYIRENDINGSIPSSISNAPMLVSFDASMSDIQGSLPSSVYNLSRLQSLDLSHNNITGCIHSSISNLKSLHILDLSENNIQGSIPRSICQIFPLQKLSLHHNHITGSLPACISKLRNLTVLDVNENSIGGNVSLISLINELDLTLLNLRSNRLTVVVDQKVFICEVTHLYHLNLSHNHLTGGIPSCISKFQNLHTFDISNNKLGGPLPPLPSPPYINYSDVVMFPFVASSSQLSSFDVSNNKLSGEIIIESGERRNSFRSINLARNELSGSIPFSICSKDSESSPQYIDFSNNKLSGVIPTSIGHCSSLVSLNLGSNNLTGSLPSEIEQAKGLQYLQLQDNNLDGTLLHFNGKHQGLEVLNLANNRFGGSITMLLSSCYQLWILSLRSNNFNGSIPHEISHLQSLRILDLSQNDLSGTIPRQIGDLGLLLKSGEYHVESFVGDDLIDIQLQRVIKGIMVQFDKLFRYSSGIDLSCNALEGNIPYEIGLLQGLSSFNLSHNRFSGVIPKSVGNMSSLESLDLSSNKLSGHIPQSLATIDFLGHLNLSFNNLSGRIPRGLHFDTLSGDGLAYANNSLLCGSYTNNICEDDQRSKATDGDSPIEGYEDDKEVAKEKLLLYAIVALGFGVGFWGLFLVLLLKKEKWWFGYWRLVDVVAVRVANCLL